MLSWQPALPPAITTPHHRHSRATPPHLGQKLVQAVQQPGTGAPRPVQVAAAGSVQPRQCKAQLSMSWRPHRPHGRDQVQLAHALLAQQRSCGGGVWPAAALTAHCRQLGDAQHIRQSSATDARLICGSGEDPPMPGRSMATTHTPKSAACLPSHPPCTALAGVPYRWNATAAA